MKGALSRFFLVGCFLTACCFLCHCGTRKSGVPIPETAQQAEEAARIVQSILDTNTQISTIKGIGFVKIEQDNQSNTFRAAWIGSRPEKFRLEILAATGQPVMSFASDGRRHYLLSYSDNRLYRRKASQNVLRRLISIAISPEDILDLLSGRLPVSSESRAVVERYNETGAPVIMLEAMNGGDRTRISPGTTADTAFPEIERFDRRGRLKFKAAFEEMQDIEGVRIPKMLTIKNDNGAIIRIEIERYWVNPVVSEDRFVLKPIS